MVCSIQQLRPCRTCKRTTRIVWCAFVFTLVCLIVLEASHAFFGHAALYYGQVERQHSIISTLAPDAQRTLLMPVDLALPTHGPWRQIMTADPINETKTWNGESDQLQKMLAWHLSNWTANAEVLLAYLSHCRHDRDVVPSGCLDLLRDDPSLAHDQANGIPRILHRIWECEEIPEQNEAAAWSWLTHAPEYAVIFWTNEARIRFIRLVLGAQHEQLYKQLLPGAYRADLFRYVVLFYIGGYYSDMDTQPPGAD